MRYIVMDHLDDQHETKLRTTKYNNQRHRNHPPSCAAGRNNKKPSHQMLLQKLLDTSSGFALMNERAGKSEERW